MYFLPLEFSAILFGSTTPCLCVGSRAAESSVPTPRPGRAPGTEKRTGKSGDQESKGLHRHDLSALGVELFASLRILSKLTIGQGVHVGKGT